MRVSKPLICANIGALALNGIIIGLMAVKMFPPMLGIILIVAFLLGSVWLSCYANGRLLKKTPKYFFYAATTQEVERT